MTGYNGKIWLVEFEDTNDATDKLKGHAQNFCLKFQQINSVNSPFVIPFTTTDLSINSRNNQALMSHTSLAISVQPRADEY